MRVQAQSVRESKWRKRHLNLAWRTRNKVTVTFYANLHKRDIMICLHGRLMRHKIMCNINWCKVTFIGGDRRPDPSFGEWLAVQSSCPLR